MAQAEGAAGGHHTLVLRLLAVHRLEGSGAAQGEAAVGEVPLLGVEAEAQTGSHAALLIGRGTVLHEVVLRRLWEERRGEMVVMVVVVGFSL